MTVSAPDLETAATQDDRANAGSASDAGLQRKEHTSLEAQLNVSPLGMHEQSPQRQLLLQACMRGDVQTVKALLEGGADVMEQDADRYTCLHAAAQQTREEEAFSADSVTAWETDHHRGLTQSPSDSNIASSNVQQPTQKLELPMRALVPDYDTLSNNASRDRSSSSEPQPQIGQTSPGCYSVVDVMGALSSRPRQHPCVVCKQEVDSESSSAQKCSNCSQQWHKECGSRAKVFQSCKICPACSDCPSLQSALLEVSWLCRPHHLPLVSFL